MSAPGSLKTAGAGSCVPDAARPALRGETGGNFRRASNLLNISRTTLYAKLKQYGIEADTFRD